MIYDHIILTIADQDELYRRVNPMSVKDNGEVSKSAFITNKIPDDEISMDLASHTTLKRTSQGRKREMPVIRLLAALPRSLGFIVRHDPLPNERDPKTDNYAHCLVEGENDTTKCDALAAGSQCIYWPDKTERMPPNVLSSREV